jgi:hypothetical protein
MDSHHNCECERNIRCITDLFNYTDTISQHIYFTDVVDQCDRQLFRDNDSIANRYYWLLFTLLSMLL